MESTTAAVASQDKIQRELALLLIFRDTEVASCLGSLIATVSYLPHHWAVTEDDRALVQTLFATPKLLGGSVLFRLPVTGTPAQIEGWAKLIQELANRCDGRKTVLLDSSVTLLNVLAAGGLKEDVMRIAADRDIRTQPVPAKPATAGHSRVMVGINIFSGEAGLGGALTNCTLLAAQKGGIKRRYPVHYVRRTYPDLEAAYQQLKGENPIQNDRLMVDLISAKLLQHPTLLTVITDRGGVPFLRECSHDTGARSPGSQAWEGAGTASRFIRNLIAGYEQALRQEIAGQKQMF